MLGSPVIAVHEPQSRLFDDQPTTGMGAEAADHEYLRLVEPSEGVESDTRIDVVDLFAGCGGLTLGALEGARREGISARLARAVDDDPLPLAVLRETLRERPDRFMTANLGRLLRPLGGRLSAEEIGLRGAVENTLLL